MYKIKDVETLTGIKAHTIRMWEKRYGFLSPERTDTKIRFYSDEDLLYILNIALLNQNGWKISTISKLSKSQVRQEIASLFSSKTIIDATQSLLVKALLELNEGMFRDTLTHLVEAEGLEKVYRKDLLPFLDRIGVMWQIGSIDPAQEHFISNLIRQLLIVEIDKLPSVDSEIIDFVLACPPDEWHELGLLFYHYTLKKQSQNIIYLGQNVPLNALISVVQRVQPTRGVVLSFVKRVSNEELTSFLKSLRASTHIPVYIGGAQSEIDSKLNIHRVYKVNDLIDSFV
jgi:DNA-binding transcriptional MerR regulator